MAKKKMLTGTVTVTFKVRQTDGATPETLNAIEEHLETEWAGLEMYIADPDQEDETVVEMTVEKISVSTD